jgi:hypothetical protein
MVLDCFNDCARARSLGTAAGIKIMEEPSLVFTGLWLLSKIYKIVLWKKKEYEDLKYLLVSFRRMKSVYVSLQ